MDDRYTVMHTDIIAPKIPFLGYTVQYLNFVKWKKKLTIAQSALLKLTYM